jgi:hypothetical protein
VVGLQSCALTTARHVESYLRKAWDWQSGVRALAFKMALGSATLQVNPAAWRYSPRSFARSQFGARRVFHLSTAEFRVSNSIQIQNSRLAQSKSGRNLRGGDAMLIADYIAISGLIVLALLWAVI